MFKINYDSDSKKLKVGSTVDPYKQGWKFALSLKIAHIKKANVIPSLSSLSSLFKMSESLLLLFKKERRE